MGNNVINQERGAIQKQSPRMLPNGQLAERHLLLSLSSDSEWVVPENFQELSFFADTRPATHVALPREAYKKRAKIGPSHDGQLGSLRAEPRGEP